MTDLTTNTHGKVHHANTAQGWVAYEADKAECYKCGHCHTLFDGTPCLHPAVNCLESIYRGVTGKIIRESHNTINPTSRPLPSPPVNVASIQELPLGQSLQLVPEADGYPAHYIIITSPNIQGNGGGPTV